MGILGWAHSIIIGREVEGGFQLFSKKMKIFEKSACIKNLVVL